MDAISSFPDLAVIIVNWNLKEDLLLCIRSVLGAGIALEQIILVDNASEDGSVAAVREQFGTGVNILESQTNLGFAGGNNLGIRQAFDKDARWIFLLNNDTTVAPEMFLELVRAVQDHPEYGILSPLIFYDAAPQKIWYLGHRLIAGTMITRPMLHGKSLPEGYPSLKEIDFPVGSGVMVNRKVFEEIGLLDESLFMYAEETEFFWRARLANFKMACITTAHMWHKVSLSANRDRPKTRYLRIRNQILFYRKYTHGVQKGLMWVFTFIRTLIFSIVDVIQRQPALLASSWNGFWGGWFGQLPSTQRETYAGKIGEFK